jgi:hypothetical protein
MLWLLALACTCGGAAPTAATDDVSSDEAATSEDVPRVYRLTHEQWEHSVQALLDLPEPSGLSAGFIGNTMSRGFDNDADVLLVDGILFQDYQQAAQLLAAQVTGDDSLYDAVAPGLRADGVDDWLRAFGEAAHRRPLTEAELESWKRIYALGPELVDSGDEVRDGVHIVIQAMLQSPGFLYRVESGEAGEPLNGWEAAAKLSYTLWDRPPDAALLADVETLHEREVFASHAARMLGETEARASMSRMFKHMLRFDDYPNIEKDYEWDTSLRDDMHREGEAFLDEVVFSEQQGLRRLLTADFTYANAAIGDLYGLDITGDELQRVSLDPGQRSGMLTLSGFLTLMSEDEQSNPIRRGGYVLERMLCIEVPPPPDATTGVGAMEEGLSNRERVDRHTGEGTCGEGCHTLINPLGFAFENYDGLGRWRTIDHSVEVDASDTFVLDGEEIAYDNAVELMAAMSTSEQVHRCFAEHVVRYTHGRELQDADESVVDELTASSLAGAPVLSLIVDAVSADSFRCNH